MGCCSSQASAADVPEVRRRLSLSDVEGVDENADATEEERSLVVQLSDKQLLDLIGEVFDVDRKYSIGSETDEEMHRKNSFSQKTTRMAGDTFSIESEGLGYACKKGLKPEAPNQDSFFMVKVEGHFSIYGVFDGHGRKGHDISNFAKDQLPKVLVAQADIETDTTNALKTAFMQTQRLIEQATNMQRIDALKSGTTASVVLHHHRKNMLYVAHVGDSRCVLGRRKLGDDAWIAQDLTEDHKPNNPAEKDRIEKGGGEVKFDGHYNYRVYAKGKKYPGLNMSRAMGDLMGYYDAGLSPVPDVARRSLGQPDPTPPPPVPEKPTPPQPGETVTNMDSVSPVDSGDEKANGDRTSPSGHPLMIPQPSMSSHSLDPSCDHFVLVCSDGVWEFINSEEAVQICAEFPPGQAMNAAETLATESWDRWMHFMRGAVVDDITALVVHFNINAKNGDEGQDNKKLYDANGMLIEEL